MEIKALTVQQPFAELIAKGEKLVENRTKSIEYRGKLAIHAAKRSRYLSSKNLLNYETGRVVAISELVDCIRIEEIERHEENLAKHGYTVEEIRDHEYSHGPYLWVLKNTIRVFPTIEAKGNQSLWNWKYERQEQ